MQNKFKDHFTKFKNHYGNGFNILIGILIIASLICYAIETTPNLNRSYKDILNIFEYIFIISFSIEYIVRIISGKFKYVLSFFGIIDLLSIIPFFILFIPQLNIIKILRLIRLLRIFKMIRYFEAFKNIIDAIKNVKKELVIYALINFVIIYFLSTIMYYIEGPVQPDKFGSIMESMWWAVVTLTTIGYGDVVPITVAGKVITGIISILGIGVITIPTGLIASTLMKNNKKTIDLHLEHFPDTIDRLGIDEELSDEVNEEGKLRGFD
jgi:voltage-gated potassium channel